MIVIGIIILIVVPPEKLPVIMREVGRFMNDVRRQTSGIWDDLKKEAAFNPEDYDVKKMVLKKPDETVSHQTESSNSTESGKKEDQNS